MEVSLNLKRKLITIFLSTILVIVLIIPGTFAGSYLAIVQQKEAKPVSPSLQVSCTFPSATYLLPKELFWGEELLDIGTSVACDSEENIVVGGLSSDLAVVLKYNSSGSLLWELTYQPIEDSRPWINSLCIDSDNNIYCVGNNRQPFIMKVSSAGELLWFLNFSRKYGYSPVSYTHLTLPTN